MCRSRAKNTVTVECFLASGKINTPNGNTKEHIILATYLLQDDRQKFFVAVISADYIRNVSKLVDMLCLSNPVVNYATIVPTF